MKKIFIALAALAVVSCVKDERDPQSLIPAPDPVYDYSGLVLNELCGAGEDNEKYWEIYNGGSEDVDLKNVYINKDEELAWTGAKGQVIKVGEVFAIVGAKGTTEKGFSSGFSAKKSVIVELFAPDGSRLDVFQRGEKGSEWGAQGLDNNTGSWSRIPNGSGKFMITPNKTPGAANNGEEAVEDAALVGNKAVEAPAEPEGTVVLNELNGNGEDNEKYWELYNLTNAEISLNGYTICKDESTDAAWTGDETDKIPAKGYFTIVGAKGTTPDGFSGGFSAGKTVMLELKDPTGTVIDEFRRGSAGTVGWGETSLDKSTENSFSRVPDGIGEWKYAAPTPGEANGASTGEIEHE